MKKYFFLLVVANLCLYLSAAEIRYDTYAAYLKDITVKREGTFDPGTDDYSSEQILRLGLKARKYENIVVLFDTSGSTAFQDVSNYEEPTPESVNRKISEIYREGTINDEHLQEHLEDVLNLHTRLCPSFLDSAFISKALQSLRAGKSLDFQKIDELAQNDQQEQVKTKHISLAQAEGLARIFKILSLTENNNTNLFLLSFSNDIQLPVGIAMPHVVAQAKDYAHIARNLCQILPRPSFGGTSLAPALERAVLVMQKAALGNTLLIIVTDGQTSDPQPTARLLNDLSKNLEAAGKILDIFAVGAGSIITSHVVPVVRHIGFESYNDRFSNFSHVSGSSASFSANECNMGYLQSLTNFKTLFGRGAYEGAYLNYSALNEKFIDFLTDEKDMSNGLYIQRKSGKWWSAKSHQYKIAQAALLSDEKIINYEKDQVKATIIKLDDPTLSKNIIKVTDRQGVTRFYLCAPKHLLEFDVDSGVLTTSSQDIQDILDFMARNND
jgi:hypothetical protein